MSLVKTEKGRRALLERATGIGVLERRVLILSDGRRGRETLLGLLGTQATPALDRLLHDGYLADTAASRMPALSLVTGASGTLAAPSVATPTATAASPRRSLPASRMYLVDMLQLRRDVASAALAARIHASRSEAELVEHMRDALQHIEHVASASYAARVRERLAEVIPEALLPALSAQPAAARALESVA